jgi:hypothetical protein
MAAINAAARALTRNVVPNNRLLIDLSRAASERESDFFRATRTLVATDAPCRPAPLIAYPLNASIQAGDNCVAAALSKIRRR